MTRAVGDVLPPFALLVTAESVKLWAEILHDPNPLHLDPAAVRAAGLGERVINQGPSNLACIINALDAAFPEGTIESLDVRYLNNVFEGSTVEASAKIVDIAVSAGTRRTTCEVWLTADGREAVLGGSAVVSEPLAALPP